MRVVVIGGTGHIGTHLVPGLVALGHEVVVLSRGSREPYQPHGSWAWVQRVRVDREAGEDDGTFPALVADLDAEVVIDLVCFTERSATLLADALDGRVGHLLHCGTIWVHGPSTEVPTREDSPRRPFNDYGIAKAAIEADLLRRSHTGGVPTTVIHPGHISGPGWVPINPAGHLDLAVFQNLADGRPVTLPGLGMETLHHVHAADVAGVFLAAIANRSVAIGESFHAVASTALTLRGYAEAVAHWFGRDADLAFQPWDEWTLTVTPDDARTTLDHISHSSHCSMDKAERLLGFRPRYSASQTVLSAIEALVDDGRLTRP
ncbi:MAG: NAD-dependent epimerase/dehydratase family protein [Lapillicoccus sp.]